MQKSCAEHGKIVRKMLVITNNFFQKINGKIPELLYIRY